MKPRDVIILSVCFAFATICLWVSLQVVAPYIAVAAATLEQVPNLTALLFVGCAVTYIFKGLVD